MLAGYGLTSKVIIDQRTGEKHEGEISRFLKQLEYKDISNQVDRCSEYKGILCVDTINHEERYCQTNKNHLVTFKLIFPFFLTSSSGCFGDSGGPMHKTKNGRTTIIGLTSGSDDEVIKDNKIFLCNGLAYFTRVGYYLKWIEETIGGQEDHC